MSYFLAGGSCQAPGALLESIVAQADAGAARTLLDDAEDPFLCSGGLTLLHAAVVADGADDIATLAESGLSVDKGTPAPLHLAAQCGALKAAEALLELEANVDAVQDGQTALSLVARSGKDAAVSFLLAKGAALRPRGLKAAQHPLVLAALHKHASTVGLLMKSLKEANEGDEGEGEGAEAATLQQALKAACEGGDVATLKLLLSAGADVEAAAPAAPHETALWTAVRFGNVAAATELIKRGAKTDVKDETAKSLLHLAAAPDQLRSAEDALGLLNLFESFDVDKGTKTGVAALMFAAAANNWVAVRHLLARGARVNGGDDCANTPLHAAAKAGSVECCRKLVLAGAEVLRRNTQGRSPSDLAREAGQTETVEALKKVEHPVLEVTVVCAQGLCGTKGSKSPYCEVKLRTVCPKTGGVLKEHKDAQKQTTQTIQDNVECPQWDETYTYNMAMETDALRVSVFGKRAVLAKVTLGRVDVMGKEMQTIAPPTGEAKEITLPIAYDADSPKASTVTGTMTLKIRNLRPWVTATVKQP
eukprot:Rhum_TRINITY_DN10721_c0_g1::Rhum_TRINITY_DN10721_c0_g1_i1::g.39916::m.39916/K15502/ANKRD28; serine/threonine-protein phosphatase 6 regulatory ankyrin repeat subunit A